MKKVLFPTLIMALFSFLAFAQSDLNKKLSVIKGNVDEIIIKSNGQEFKFSGNDAETLFAKMKQEGKMKSFQFFTDDGKIITSDSLKKKVVIKDLIDEDNFDDVLVFINENGETDTLGNDIQKIEKKIKVSDNDGKKVVTVTTKENGKENVEVYEGKAAENYLDKMKNDNEFDMEVEGNKDAKGKKIKRIIIEKDEEIEN